MSRIGKKPIPLPTGVRIEIALGRVEVTGPRGTLAMPLHRAIQVRQEDGTVLVSPASASQEHQALHGLTRTLIANMVVGVSQGFQKSLELVGVGYRAQQSGQDVVLQVGHSHQDVVRPLSGVTLQVEGANRVNVRGADKQMVGEMAAQIRRIRPPNRYSGKGVRYVGELVRLKPGKAAAKGR